LDGLPSKTTHHIEVFINQEKHLVQKNIVLDKLLLDIDIIEKNGIAVAINNEIISKSKWKATGFSPNDRITVIRATQGG
jgi:sulfur carrier protein